MTNGGKVIIKINGDTKDLTKQFDSIKKMAGKAASGIKIAFAASSAAIGAIGTAAVKAYGDFEQLVGGVDTLFKESSATVQKYADDAYKTAGMSANDYMQTITSFSASLLQSLGGDTKKAAEYGNQAVIDMSDNVNKMGSKMEDVEHAYQGFAKQNYTMLDNLKLGYGGTQDEMKRLLEDAGKLAGTKFDISSFADITQAIHVIQTEMGITGTTAEEAATTIQGSFGMVKGSLENLMNGLADPDADFDKLFNDFYDSLNSLESNIIPVIERVLSRMPELVTKFGKLLAQNVPDIIAKVLPGLIDSASELISAFADTVEKQSPKIADAAIDVCSELISGIISSVPRFVSAGGKLVESLAKGIYAKLPVLSTAAGTVTSVFESINITSATKGIISKFKEVSRVLNDYTSITANSKATQLEWFAVLNPLEKAVGILTGKISLQTAAQAALNAVRSVDPVYLIVAGTVALTAAIAGSVVAYNAYIEKHSEMINKAKEMVAVSEEAKEKAEDFSETVSSLGENASKNISDLEAEAYANENLADELYSLAEQSEKTAAEKSRMKDIVDQLNGSVDDLNLKLDEETGTLNLTKEAVSDLINKKLEMAKTNAVSEIYTEQLKNQYKAQVDATDAVQKMAEAKAKIAEIESKASEKNRGYTAEEKKALKELQTAVSNYSQVIGANKKAVNDSFNAMQNLANVAKIELPAGFQASKSEAEGFFDGLTGKMDTTIRLAGESGDEFIARYTQNILDGKYDAYKAGYENGKSAAQGTVDGANSVFAYSSQSGMKLGTDFTGGFSTGIEKGTKNVTKSAKIITNEAIFTVKKTQQSNSPSKVTKKLGGDFGDGYAYGILDKADDAKKAAKELTESALEVFDDNRTEVQKVTDEMNEKLLDSEIKYNSESERLKNSKSEADKKYLESLKETAEKERKIYDALQKDIEKSQKSIVSSIKSFADDAVDSIDEVIKAQQKMEEKLEDYGNLYNKDKYIIGGTTYEVASLADISKQNEVLREYADILLSVKERGNVPTDFFAQLRDLSVDDGLMFAKGLLNVSDEEFDKYMADFQTKQETAAAISKLLYADEARDAADEIKSGFDTLNGDIEQKGKDNAAAWSAGFKEKLNELMPKILNEITAGISTMFLSIGENGIQTVNNNNTSNVYNITANSNETNTDTLRAWKDWQKLQKARGGY